MNLDFYLHMRWKNGVSMESMIPWSKVWYLGVNHLVHYLYIVVCHCVLRNASHLESGVKNTLEKVPSRGWGRVPLKYTNYRVCICLKRNFVRSRRVWVSTKQTLGTETHKICYHVGILEGIVLWSLAFSMKAKWTNFCSAAITSLESFVCSTIQSIP
jgi:hypothetical protein